MYGVAALWLQRNVMQAVQKLLTACVQAVDQLGDIEEYVCWYDGAGCSNGRQ
jgi:hypothetical protein